MVQLFGTRRGSELAFNPTKALDLYAELPHLQPLPPPTADEEGTALVAPFLPGHYRIFGDPIFENLSQDHSSPSVFLSGSGEAID